MAGLGGVEEGIAAARAFGARDVVVAHRELRSGRRQAVRCGGLRLPTAAAGVSDSPDANSPPPGRLARPDELVLALVALRERRVDRCGEGRIVALEAEISGAVFQPRPGPGRPDPHAAGLPPMVGLLVPLSPAGAG